jgi:alanine-glyoxylate transaminase/serine-glyoxylate transaminase/serine-pyruvate transaminase
VRVLIVDDHEFFRRGLHATLTRHGFEVAGEARTGEEGVAMTGALRPDAVLMDLNMPGISGAEAVARIVAAGSPPPVSVLTVSARARDLFVDDPEFSLDLSKLEDFWVRRKYHHTISAPLIYALYAALGEVREEGLEARWIRHTEAHQALVSGVEALGLQLLPPPGDRLVSLNAVSVPEGTDAAAVKEQLLTKHHIEIGAGLGPLAGKIWRIGLMGSGATVQNARKVVAGLADALGRSKPGKKKG